MPLLLLIRHGENDYVKAGKLAGRLPEVHLNERGRQQAEELAQALANVPIKAVYSSPLERARETAAPLAAKLGLEMQIRPGLMETGIGTWTGQELKALRKLPEWKLVQEAPSRFRFPQGESFAETQLRMVNEIEAILALHQKEDVIACVSHADPIKLATAYYLGMPLDHFQRLGCDTASVTALWLSEKGVLLSKLNQRPPFAFALPEKKARR
ncbi:MAG: histidine phosphatase family protein [Anaerolineales bacterium]|nr:histidine phosphatase family protein [Anaerolineales bacterium]MCX7756681.1 histidine phosphatase family protein [Anaerolineales bacterium]MDW8279260.1 histidine phosphatase family protein [Anaerolineales bacterium]